MKCKCRRQETGRGRAPQREKGAKEKNGSFEQLGIIRAARIGPSRPLGGPLERPKTTSGPLARFEMWAQKYAAHCLRLSPVRVRRNNLGSAIWRAREREKDVKSSR